MPYIAFEWPNDRSAAVMPVFGDTLSRNRQNDAVIQITYERRMIDGEWKSFGMARVEAPQEKLDAILARAAGTPLLIAAT